MTLSARRTRLWFVLGFSGLAASVAGAGWLLQSAAGDGPHPAGESGAGTHRGSRVVCVGHVDAERGVSALSPLQSGRVARILVGEGEAVKAGTVLLRLDDGAAHGRVQEAEQDLQASLAQRAQARQGPDQHQAKVAQQQALIEVMQRRLSAADNALTVKQKLRKDSFLAAEELNSAADLVAELRAAVRAEQEKLRELRLNDAQVMVARSEAEVAAKQARLEQAQRVLEECTLRAPTDGKVLRIHVSPGDVLGPQAKQPAVLFCPDGPRVVRAEVEQEFAGRVKVGQAAMIQDDTRAEDRWRGKVLRISDWYTQRRSVMQDPLQLNDVRTLECIIAVASGQPPLRIGQRVRVTLE
jgi:multidrug resistance efflux pump